MQLAKLSDPLHNTPAKGNPLAEIGLSNIQADTPLALLLSGFFMSVIALYALPLWWACSGGHLVCAVFLNDGRPTPLHAHRQDWSLGGGLLTPNSGSAYHA